MKNVKHNFGITFQSNAIDDAAGIIYGVAVATIGEARGHNLHLDSKTLVQLKTCAETYKGGLKVKADHGSGIFSTAGLLKNFRLVGDVLRADLHLLDSEKERSKILEMADKIPDTFGLSVSFSGPDETKGKKKFARCVEIYSADLVPEPAANPTGLFSVVDNANDSFSNKSTTHNMATEDETKEKDPIAELSEKFSAFADAVDKRFAAFEKPEPKKEDEDKVDMAALASDIKNLSVKFDILAKRKDLSTAITPAPVKDGDETKVEKKDFSALVADTMSTKNLSKPDAVTFCVKNHPEEHKAFIASGKTSI